MSSLPFSPRTYEIVNAISKCCATFEIDPADLLPGQFWKWAKHFVNGDVASVKELQAHVQQCGGFNNIKNTFFSCSPTALTKEKSQLKNLAKTSRASANDKTENEIFLDRFQDVMKSALKEYGSFKPFGCSLKKSTTKKSRVVTLMLSDLHLGSRLDGSEGFQHFDFQEESRALASVVKRLCEFKRHHRKETRLVIWVGGDVIRGKIHDKQGGRPVAEQSADAIFLLTQAIRYCAAHFAEVDVYFCTGNHDRDESRHQDRAFDQKWDSRSTVIYYGVKNAFDASYKNVRCHIPRTPYCEWEMLGHRFYATHGDTELDVGNPSNTVNINKIHRQMTEINLAETSKGHKPYAAFLCGHVHQGMNLPLPAGHLVINPALIPPDGYARGVGYKQSKWGQVMFETTENHVVGDQRYFFVNENHLKDKSLDKIIAPFGGF